MSKLVQQQVGGGGGVAGSTKATVLKGIVQFFLLLFLCKEKSLSEIKISI